MRDTFSKMNVVLFILNSLLSQLSDRVKRFTRRLAQTVIVSLPRISIYHINHHLSSFVRALHLGLLHSESTLFVLSSKLFLAIQEFTLLTNTVKMAGFSGSQLDLASIRLLVVRMKNKARGLLEEFERGDHDLVTEDHF